MGAIHQKRIGRFEIDYEVGAGGLGKVYRAVDTETGRVVAVKVLHEKYQKSKRFLGIFHRELLIVSRLKHKHIVEYIEANYKPPNCYIVSEFIDGWSLHRLIKHYKKMPPLIALSIAIDILQGIDYLHLHDTIHSDLSSPNVMIARNGRVLVTDFGLSCNGEFENYKNYMIGTPGYYSPEHVTDAAIQTQSDLYCVGLLLFEMIAGEKAVKATKHREEILPAMRSIDFSKIRCSERRLQSLIRSLLKKSLAFRINKRFQSAEIMVYEIFKILKKYEIRYARHAIHQFLGETGLSLPIPAKYKQEIDQGFIPVDEDPAD
ncbi:MAG: serine/threonine protein kinase [Oligoflexus sp.]